MGTAVDLSTLKIGSRCRTRGDEVLSVRDLRKTDGRIAIYWEKPAVFWFYTKDGLVHELSPHKHDIVEILPPVSSAVAPGRDRSLGG